MSSETGPTEKKGFEFPSTMTVLIIVTLLVWIAAFLIPSGTYERDENGVPTPGSYSRSTRRRTSASASATSSSLRSTASTASRTRTPASSCRSASASSSARSGVFLFVLAIGAFMTMVLATGALDVAIGKLAYAVRGGLGS